MANRGSGDSRDGPISENEGGSSPQAPQGVQESDSFMNSPGTSGPSGPPPNLNGAAAGGVPAINLPGPTAASIPSGPPTAVPKVVDDVVNSDIGISVLLTRLKQSVSSARDFAAFLKKRSSLEDEHAQGLRKLARTTSESVRRPDSRQGSYAFQLSEMTRTHERMAENGIQFSLSLHQMNEDLTELSNNMDKGRKHWKAEGLANEKRVKDAELAMQKARSQYEKFAESYDRARTGDTSGGKVFGLKGPKSAAQHEEDLLRKVQNADSDYASKVQLAQSARQENLKTNRPQAIKALQELIAESDSALTLQLQKFATFNEKLLVSNGLVVSPVKGENTPNALSMREMISQIDNERDLHSYISGQAVNIPARTGDIKYEKHPSLAPQQTPSPNTQRVSQLQPTGQPPSYSAQPQTPYSSQQPPSFAVQPPQQPIMQSQGSPQSPQQGFLPERGFSGPPLQSQYQQSMQNGPNYAPQTSLDSKPPLMSGAAAPIPNGAKPQTPTKTGPPAPLKPMFGVTLDDLYIRDGSAVPMVIYQCIQAIDSFGLEVEGIYRLSGNANHINQMKAAIDADASSIDFRNPENFHHDINSVAGLLKQFLRDLPDPLLTSEHYTEFIDAARAEDNIIRRDSLHAVINALPDPNYATLRALILHLNRVQENSQVNRMSTSNLAICIAPAMLGPHRGPRLADAGLQSRVVDTIIQNTYQIFDED